MNAEMGKDFGIGEVLGGKTDRRTFLRRALGVGAVAAAGVAGVALTGGSASADYTGFYLTTTSVNFRTGPGTTYKVIRVLGKGTGLTDDGASKNGFRRVSHQGTVGWVSQQYLTDTNGGSSDMPVIVGQGMTTSQVNFRVGPSTGDRVIHTLRQGAILDLTDRYSNGFRYVYHAQAGGWVYADYIKPYQDGPLGGTVTATADVNVREGASVNSKVLTVMKQGHKAYAGDVIANGYIGVNYNGINGWAHTDYLKR